ncbi:MAG: GntR family transcriptional regulator [Cyclobacteriaceae bacterium]|nr:GntR family transcriptional regulator [Cyclobacteriaceae bacterium]
MELIKINDASGTAKYKQIVESIIAAIGDGKLQLGDKIPSLNALTSQYSLSQDTVLTAYSELKHRGIISSSIGKGYFIAKTDIAERHNIFLLLDKMTAYKEVLYDAMKKSIGDSAVIDIYFHHGNQKAFDTLIKNAAGNFTAYMIVPIISSETDEVLKILPKKKVFIIDQGLVRYGKKYRSVCQHFEKDILRGLNEAVDAIKKYKHIYFVHNDQRQQFKELEKGFISFCKQHQLPYQLLRGIKNRDIEPGDMYLLLDDRDFVSLVKTCKARKMLLGSDIGLISYNDSPYKEIIAEGITTITTDFEQMGYTVIDMLFKNKTEHLENPGKIIFRASL